LDFLFSLARFGFLAAICLVSVSANLGRRILLAGADRVITRRVIASGDRVVYREKKNRDSPQKGLHTLPTERYHVIDEHWRAISSPRVFFTLPPIMAKLTPTKQLMGERVFWFYTGEKHSHLHLREGFFEGFYGQFTWLDSFLTPGSAKTWRRCRTVPHAREDNVAWFGNYEDERG
jgi:hypothetical protein